jgi:hypothetical protein
LEQKQEQSKQMNLDVALKLAREEFAKKDPREMAEKAGGVCEAVNCGNSLVSVNLLGQEHTIHHPTGNIEFPDYHNVTLVQHILLLHYLLNASGRPINNEPVSYKDIPGGQKYFPVFQKRVEMPVLNAYSESPEGFEKACLGLRGERVNMGDVAFRFQAFPKVPITYIFWKGDEEFPASLQVLFDSSVKDNLPLEDIVFLSEMLSWKIAKFKGV